jgi:cysteine synthase A
MSLAAAIPLPTRYFGDLCGQLGLMQDRILGSVVEAIGETPLVDLRRITRGLDGRILAKLEYLNPGFSKKDRIARQIIEDAEGQGTLAAGQAVVELTSGNTGTGLAIVCAIQGHPFIAVMSKGNSTERARMMSALGAEVVLVDQLPNSLPGQVSGGDLELLEDVVEELVQSRGAFRADQFRHEGNLRAHFLYTGPEFLRQADGKFDAFCDFAGTAGTFAGCAKAFKAYNAAIQCFIVEPEGAQSLAGKAVTHPNHRIQGGGYGMAHLGLLDVAHVDGYLKVSDSEAIENTRRLAREEGIFAGVSSGANVAAALQLLKGPMRGKTIAILMCDSGLKYLSTDLWR